MSRLLVLILIFFGSLQFSTSKTVFNSCLNGGIQISSDSLKCYCPRGYFGVYCDPYQETPLSYNTFPLTPSYAVVFFNPYGDNGNPASVFQDAILSDSKLDVYSQYYVFTFNSSTTSNSSTTYTNFVKQIQNLQPISSTSTSVTGLFEQLTKSITSLQFENIVINVFTQQVDYSVNDFDALINVTQAFHIKINVIYKTMKIVHPNEIVNTEPLSKLSAATGGIFVDISNYIGKPNELGIVTSTAYNLQLLAYGSTTIVNSTYTVNVALPTSTSVVNIYAQNVDSITTNGNCHAILTDNITPEFTVHTLIFFQIGICSLSVKPSANVTDSSVTIDSIAANPAIFIDVSFTDSLELDTGYSYLKHGIPLFARIHVTSSSAVTVTQVTLRNSANLISSSDVTERDFSSFNWVTQEFVCNGNQNQHWLEIIFTVNGINNTQFLPIDCKQDTSTSKSLDFEPEFEYTLDECPLQNKPSLVTLYSAAVDSNTRNSFLRGPFLLDEQFVEDNIGSLILAPFDNELLYAANRKNSSNLTDYLFKIHNASLAAPQSPSQNNFISTIISVLDDQSVTNGSTIMVLLNDVSIASNDLLRILSTATRRQIKINFFLDTSVSWPTNNNAPEFAIAGATNGHFVNMQLASAYNNNGTVAGEIVYNDLVRNSFSSQIVLSQTSNAQNLGYFVNIGSLNVLPSENATYELTASTFTSASSFNAILLTFENQTSSQTAMVSQSDMANTQINLLRGTVNVNLSPGTYNVTALVCVMGPCANIASIRLWKTVGINETRVVQISYVDPNNINDLIDPNESQSAATKGNAQNLPPFDSVTIQHFDSSGNFIDEFDSYNYAAIDNSTNACITEFFANPFSCFSNQVGALSFLSGLYNTRFVFWESGNIVFDQLVQFWCQERKTSTSCPTAIPEITTIPSVTSESTTETTPETTEYITTTESYETCDCLYNVSSNSRGNECDIPNCSGNGHLYLEGNQFSCYCTAPGFSGDYCEQGECPIDSDYASYFSTSEAAYKTVTIAVLYDNAITANVVLQHFIANLEFPEDIWQINLFSGYNDGDYTTHYFGNALKNIQFNSSQLSTNYSTEALDLTSVVEYGLKSVGKQIKGIFYIVALNQKSLVVPNISEFYNAVQGYKQEIFVTTVSNIANSTDVTNAIKATGGDFLTVNGWSVNIIHDYINKLILSENSLNYYYGSVQPVENIIENTAIVIAQNGESAPSKNCTPLLGGTVVNLTLWNCKASTTPLDTKSLISVRVQNGSTPTWTHVSATNEDNWGAFVVTDTAPKLVIKVYDSEEVTVPATNYYPQEIEQNETCTFNTAIVYRKNITEEGYFGQVLIVKNETIVNKILPFAVTSSIENLCKNNGTAVPGTVKCECPSDYSGPDCSRPNCQNGGYLNVLQNACICPISFGGPTCNGEL